MNNVKFTGVNIAAAILILSFLFPWIEFLGLSFSGFSLVSKGISPGELSSYIDGTSRIFMVMLLLVPLSGALILYQNITGNMKFKGYFKPAHYIPALYLIGVIAGLYFKLKPDTHALSDAEAQKLYGDWADVAKEVTSATKDMAPGAFDILQISVYVCLIAGVYLLLAGMGKIKDKEYYKLKSSGAEEKPASEGQQ